MRVGLSLLLAAACPGRRHGSVLLRLWAHCLRERFEGSDVVNLVPCDPALMLCVCARLCVCVCMRLYACVWMLSRPVVSSLATGTRYFKEFDCVDAYCALCLFFDVIASAFVWSGHHLDLWRA